MGGAEEQRGAPRRALGSWDSHGAGPAPDQDEVPAAMTSHADTSSLGDRAALAVLEYREGRSGAMSDLVREATPLLWRTVRAQGVERDTADDVVQQTWAALVRSVDSIAEPMATLKWLLVTARRAAWEAVRKERTDLVNRTELPDDDAETQTTLRDEGPGPEDEVLRDERDHVLWDALRRLPDRCQELLRLVSLADRPDYRSISAAIGMPIGSIGATRGRCLAKLRAVLTEHGEASWT
jgi:RNA polymerase sigma factor (sigma-70 family)